MDEQRTVRVASLKPIFSRDAFLFDPEQPQLDPNELAKRAADPRAILHWCPMCERSLEYDVFWAHIKGPHGCYARWRKVKLDITRKKFAGATPGA
jgi:hypothetical protein